MTLYQFSTVLAAGVLSALILFAGHWLPWDRFLRGGLGRIEAYTYGTVSILLAFAVAVLLNGADPWLILWLFIIDVVSGAAVCFAYWVDGYTRQIAMLRREARRPRMAPDENAD